MYINVYIFKRFILQSLIISYYSYDGFELLHPWFQINDVQQTTAHLIKFILKHGPVYRVNSSTLMNFAYARIPSASSGKPKEEDGEEKEEEKEQDDEEEEEEAEKIEG